MPRYCLLKTSCYTFARAIFEAIHTAFNGHQVAPCARNLFHTAISFPWLPSGDCQSGQIGFGGSRIVSSRTSVSFSSHFWLTCLSVSFSVVMD
ncbi:hypothetical protein M378DRAFT_346753 [Amanita muscaria Koide BX008]|uniref:Uncharacterized protein n=1 Tax=Amanita muscaria (strain Koide BX008) TaxID=946122 RepID=A0A0C2STL0_AMAMK|nr:hypothetical protein M378DRAFT_346753 [Amanita muscaria Koide BX008]